MKNKTHTLKAKWVQSTNGCYLEVINGPILALVSNDDEGRVWIASILFQDRAFLTKEKAVAFVNKAFRLTEKGDK